MQRWTLLLVLVLMGFAAVSRGCGSTSDAGAGDDGGPNGFVPLDASTFAPDCVNLCRQQVICIDGTTALTGVVMDPAGKRPVYNAQVYVPNASVPALSAGVSCDRCGSAPGKPLVSALTDAAGHFELKDVPAGKNIPLVVQIGKWRKQLVVPEVVACMQTSLSNIPLPRSKCEGDIPQMALTTGGDDTLECFLRKVGLDDAEFTTDTGAGRVHLYAGSGVQVTTAFDATKGGQAFTTAQTLWSDQTKLSRYDAVFLSCEGQLFPSTKPPAALSALKAYATAGGRVLASHWHRYWFDTRGRDADGGVAEDAGPEPSPFPPFATWNDRADPSGAVTGAIDTTLPKGAAMRFWLGDPTVAALDSLGMVPLASAHDNVDAVDATKATAWTTFANPSIGGQKAIALLSANMPTDAPAAQQCGRVTYGAIHSSTTDVPGAPWPGECLSKDMTEEEKALEFLLFDLASCIAADGATPVPPPSTTTPCTKCSLGDVATATPQTAITVSPCSAK